MSYRLGVDLGTTFTAAAVADQQSAPTMLGLGNRALQIPSVLFLGEDGTFLVGEAAERRGLGQPDRLVREFKRRIGDTVPILVAGVPFSPQALTARLLQQVIATATERMGSAPEEVVLTHPANWGPYKLELLDQVARLAGVEHSARCPEPLAAAAQYAAQTRVGAGETIAVYDLGGGTFDACLLRKTDTGFTLVGSPEGIEHLGGIDFDEALFQHVLGVLGGRLAELDPDDPDVTVGLTRLRRDCVDAKEALSTDTDTLLPVSLPGLSTTVRLTRNEFENLIRPALTDTVGALERAIRSAGLTADQLSAIVLVGGSSRIPLIGELLHQSFPTPTAMDTHPKHDIALGAVQLDRGQTVAAGADVTGPPTVRAPRMPPPAPARTGQETTLPTRTLPSQPGTAAPVAGAGAAAASAAGPTSPSTPASGATTGSPDGSPDPTPPGPRRAAQAAAEPPTIRSAQPPLMPPGTPPPGAAPTLTPFSPPPPPPADPARRRRLILGACAAAVVAGIVIGVVVVTTRDNSAAGTASESPFEPSPSTSVSSPSTSVSTPASPSTPASRGPATPAGLPRSAPLSPTQLLVQMKVGDTDEVWLGDTGSPAPLRRLTKGGGYNGGMDISPAYDSMIYIRADDGGGTNSSLRVAGVQHLEGDRRLFARPKNCVTYNRPAWNPVDPSKLAVPCIDPNGRYTIFVMSVQGKVLARITPPAGLPRVGDVVYAANGQQLGFWAASDADRDFDGGVLYTVADTGGTPQKLIKNAGDLVKGSDADLSFSPDGAYVAFRRRVPGKAGKPDQADIYRVNTDGTGLAQLTTDPAPEQNPTWSPDSKEIAYKSAVPTAALPKSSQLKIFVMTVDGKDQRPLWTQGTLGPQALAAWAPR